MQPLQFLVPIDALEVLGPFVPIVALVLVVANMATRFLAHQEHVRQAEVSEEDEALSRYKPHTATSVLLILVSFLFLILEPHGGMVLSVLVLGMVVADFFEFESRKVEARNDMEIERPNSSLVVSGLVLLYAAYQGLFFVIAPVWNAVV